MSNCPVPTLGFFVVSAPLRNSPRHPPERRRRLRMEPAVGPSRLVSAAPSTSGSVPAPGLGPPWETVLHQLPQRWSFPRGAAPQQQAAPAWGVPHGLQSPASKRLWHGLLSPRCHSSCQDPDPARTLHGLTASFGPPCSSVGSSTGCRWRSALPWTSMAAGTVCLTTVCCMAAGTASQQGVTTGTL